MVVDCVRVSELQLSVVRAQVHISTALVGSPHPSVPHTHGPSRGVWRLACVALSASVHDQTGGSAARTPGVDADEWWVAAQSESDAIRIATEQLKGTPGVSGDISLSAVRDEDVLDTWFSSVRSQI